MIKLSRGLDIPIAGRPRQEITAGPAVRTVGVVGADFVGMKPSMRVNPGDRVRKGQVLFEDKKTPGVLFTAPVAGTVREVNRGERRRFLSVVIEAGDGGAIPFASYRAGAPESYTADEVRALLLEAGAWPFLRTRPFSRTPAPADRPASLFIPAMDTNPLAADPGVVIAQRFEVFRTGVAVLAKLAEKTFVVTAAESRLQLGPIPGVRHERFAGTHPAGNVGTHIHFLDPVSATKTVWHIGYQDVIAVGHLFRTGELLSEKIIAIGGPGASNPRLVRTLPGASLEELCRNEGADLSGLRLVSGSVLGGRTAAGALGYLGQFHNQVTLLREGLRREFLGWASPGVNKFSVKNVFLSTLLGKRDYAFDTNTNGSLRSIVPIGAFEAVMPLDILPTQLLRYLMARRTEMAVALGALELDEEDLALCTFVDPCKNEYGPVLRENLELIEKEGIA
jgi:Na+-transporting NADH:ubiquinone oxidoreductase subunit A